MPMRLRNPRQRLNACGAVRVHLVSAWCVASLWDGPAADAEALAEDWRQMGADMEHAMGHIDDGLCLVMGRLDG